MDCLAVSIFLIHPCIPDNAIITSANLSLDYHTNKMTTPGDDGITVVNGNVNGIL